MAAKESQEITLDEFYKYLKDCTYKFYSQWIRANHLTKEQYPYEMSLVEWEDQFGAWMEMQEK